MRIKERDGPDGARPAETMLVAGGLLGALAASSCCILPLALFSLGVSGAWIGNFTRLAPHQPYFMAVTVTLLAASYWLAYRSSRAACAEGAACARSLPNRLVKTGLIVATMLVAAAIGFDFAAPLFLSN